MVGETRAHVCAGCGLELAGAEQLERHMRKYCIGSALHERTRERMGASSASVDDAPRAAQLERISAFLQGGAPGGRDVEKLTLTDLRTALLAERTRETQAAEDAKRWARIDEEGKGRKLRLEQVALFEAGEAQAAELEALELELREQRARALDAKAERLRALRELGAPAERDAPSPELASPALARAPPAPTAAASAGVSGGGGGPALGRLGAATLGGASLAATLPSRRPPLADAPAPSAAVAERQRAIAARRRALDASAAEEAAALEREAAQLGARRAALAHARDGGGRFPFSLDASAPADRPRSSASDAGRAYLYETQRAPHDVQPPPPTPPGAGRASPAASAARALGGEPAAMARELLAEADELERTYLARGGDDPKVLRSIGALRAEAAALFAQAAGGRADSPAPSVASGAERRTPPAQPPAQLSVWGSPPPPWEQSPPQPPQPQPQPPSHEVSWGAPPWSQPPPVDAATELLQQHLNGLRAALERQEAHATRVREALRVEAERGSSATLRRGPSTRGDSLDELLAAQSGRALAEPPPPPPPPPAEDPATAPAELRRQLDVDRVELERLKIKHESQMASLVFEKERLEVEAIVRSTQLAAQADVQQHYYAQQQQQPQSQPYYSQQPQSQQWQQPQPQQPQQQWQQPQTQPQQPRQQQQSYGRLPGPDGFGPSPAPSPPPHASTGSLRAAAHPRLSGQVYDARSGFALLLDSVEQLPARAASVRLTYAVYEGDTQRSAVRPLPVASCERAPYDGGGFGGGARRGGSARAQLGLRRDFPAMEASASTLVLIEVQQLLPTDSDAEPPTRLLGWTVVRPFGGGARGGPNGGSGGVGLNGGYWLCGLLPPPLDPSAAAAAIVGGARGVEGVLGAAELLPPPPELPLLALRLARVADAAGCEDAGEPPPSLFAPAPWLRGAAGGAAGSFGGASRWGAEADADADADAAGLPAVKPTGRRADSRRLADAAGAAVGARAAAQRGLTELAPIRLLGFAPAEPEPFLAEAQRTGRAPLAVRVTQLAGVERVGAAVWLSERGALAGDGSWDVRWPVSEGAMLALPPGVAADGAQAPCALVELLALDSAAPPASPGGSASSSPRAGAAAADAPSGAFAGAVVIGWAIAPLLRAGSADEGADEGAPFVGTRTLALRPPPVAAQLALALAAARIEAAAAPLGDADANAPQPASAGSTPRAGAPARLTIALRPPRALATSSPATLVRKLNTGRRAPAPADEARSPSAAAASPPRDAAVEPGAEAARPARALSAIASEPSHRSEPAPQPSGLPPSIWTRGNAQPPPVTQFESGDGLDVYVDGLIGMPDSVAVVRLEAGVVTLAGKRVPVTGAGGDLSVRGQPRPSADAFAPRAELRLELREGKFDPTSTLVVTVVGVHASERTPVVVGRAAFPLFALLDETAAAAALAAGERVPRRQPADALARAFAANYGAFQVRVHNERGAALRPRANADVGVLKAVGGARPVPGLSLLLRIAPAPQTADGLGLLSAEDVPAEQHEVLGLRLRAPEYASGAYDGTAATPTAQELTLLQQRARERARRADTVRDRVRAAASAPGGVEAPADDASDAELAKWSAGVLDRALNGRERPRPFALNAAFPFSRARGVAVTVLRAQNLPSAALSAAMLALSPPAGVYRAPPRVDESAHLVTDVELGTELRKPQWREPPHVFRARAFPSDADDTLTDLPHAAVVVDVRSMPKPTAPKPLVEMQGWAVLPVFAAPGYVGSGVFRLPLYTNANGGPPSAALLEAFATEGAASALARALRERRVKLVDGASVDVGLLDEVRAGEWDNGAFPDADTSALTQVCGGDARKLERYTSALRPSKPAVSVFADRLTPAMVRAKFEGALGFAS